MEESYNTTQLDPSALQNLLGGSAPSLIPESLVTALTVGFIVLNVLGILFMIFYVISMIRKWRVESATLHMQKDIAEIKDILSKQSPAQPAPEPIVQPVQAAPLPDESYRTIANSDEPTNQSTV
ncbi:hypothetical protein H7142_01105 [Candidatus Saccharibacteria bacterium]|nr:hypothetical protein [Candidatus Saccharibacteria bacterium]